MVGNTPLLKLDHLFPNSQVFAKCEFMNPLSLKDRPVKNIIEKAEAAQEIKPGDTIIECTSGNTGMALAFIGAMKGYEVILVMSEIQSVERRKIMEALGAKLILTPAKLGTKGAKSKLNAILLEHPEYFYLGQHVNPSNPGAHYETTGPEIWSDTDGKIDILVAGLGTGGTLCGCGRYLKEKKSTVKLVGVEPEIAPFISQGKFSPHLIMGTAPGFLPKTIDRNYIDDIELIKEEDAFAMCRTIAVKEGILVGISSGATASIVSQMLKQPENRDKVIVCIFADTGQRYLSVNKLFS